MGLTQCTRLACTWKATKYGLIHWLSSPVGVGGPCSPRQGRGTGGKGGRKGAEELGTTTRTRSTKAALDPPPGAVTQTSDLVVSRPDAGQDAVAHGDGCGGAGHRHPNLRHELDDARRADVGRLAAHVGSRDDHHVLLPVHEEVVGNEGHAFLWGWGGGGSWVGGKGQRVHTQGYR